MSEHQVWDELAAGYALHALEPADDMAFTEHLAGCDRCRAEVDQHALIAAQLGALAEGDHSADSNATSDAEAATDVPSWSSIRAGVVSAPVDELAVRRRRRYNVSRRVMAAAAAVVILAGGGIAAWRLSTGSSSPASCHDTANCHVVALTTLHGNNQLGSVVVNGNVATIEPTGMSRPPAGERYFLWQVPRDGRPRIVTQFSATGNHATANGLISVPYADLLWFGVSEEPAGTVPSKPSRLLAEGTTA